MMASERTIRWGDLRTVLAVPLATTPEPQFVDITLESPREVLISLMATAAPPVAGLSVQWTVYLGCGAAMVVERLTVPVDDVSAPVPTVLRRMANVVRVACAAVNTVTGPGPVPVLVSALAGPVLSWR